MSCFDDTIRITEKRYLEIAPRSFTLDATNTGILTISSTYAFKVGQLVIVKSDTQPDIKVKIQRVISTTQLVVIAINESVTTRNKLDMSAYTVADLATIEFLEDKRPVIDLHEIQRQTYEEEPTIANRVYSVDWLGRGYSDCNRLPVALPDNGFAPNEFDDLKITRDCDGDAEFYNFYKNTVLIAKIQVVYDCDKLAVEYKRVI